MTDPKKPGFMKLSISKETATPPPPTGPEGGVPLPSDPPPAPFTPGQIAAAEAMAKKGGVLGEETPKGEMTEMFDGIGDGTIVTLAPEPHHGAQPAEAPASLADRADLAARVVRDALGAAKIAVILGSGLGGFADSLDGATFLEYVSVPYFPRSTVAGHRGRLAHGTRNGVPVLCMQGRFHYYEGYELEDVTFPVRVFARLGVKLLVITNAAGGIGDHLAPGDLMLIRDHLNLMGVNPLRGPHDDRLGPRFPDMTEVYAARFRDAVQAALPEGGKLKEGVYAALSGPSYETPSEIRMLRTLGADAIGMSTVPEATVAAQMGLGVVGISGIANMAAGLVRGHRLTHKEVVDTMSSVGGKFGAVIAAALPGLEKAIG